MRKAVPFAFLCLCGCSATSQQSQDQLEAKRAILDKIAVPCDLPTSTFQLTSTDELHMQPPVGAKYEAVDCALQKLRKVDARFLRSEKMGFIGNERYLQENTDAQRH
jgi:hypothetical protein